MATPSYVSHLTVRKAVLHELKNVDPTELKDDSDFFSLGLDSFGVRSVCESLKMAWVNHGTIYKNSTIETLTARLRRGSSDNQLHANVATIFRLIDKYSSFQHRARDHTACTDYMVEVDEGTKEAYPDGHHVLVTGATGSLGSHIVAQLVAQDSVKRVYCLVRRDKNFNPLQRVVASLKSRKLLHSATGGIPTEDEAKQLAKIQAYNSNLVREDLGLGTEDYDGLLQRVTEVIHCAWTMNYDMQLTSFEHLIRGASNLISFCLKSTQILPASFNFASSIAAAPADPTSTTHPAVAAVAAVKGVTAAQGVDAVAAVAAVHAAPAGMVLESLNTNPNLLSLGSGYAQSKCVVEYLCANAVQQSHGFLSARIHRLGYLAGDRAIGKWSNKEEYPSIVRSLEKIKSLPSRPLEHFSLLPVDDAAKACVELMFSVDEDLGGLDVFNVAHPKLISWDDVFLAGVSAAGLPFTRLSSSLWIAALKAANPTYPLLEYFNSAYAVDDDVSGRIATAIAQKCSQHLRECPAIDANLVKLFVEGWDVQVLA